MVHVGIKTVTFKASYYWEMMAEKGGLEKLDIGALSAEQQEKLRQFKVVSFVLRSNTAVFSYAL